MAPINAYHHAVPVLASVLARRGYDTSAMANLGPFEIDTMLNGQALKFSLQHKTDSSRCYVHFDTEPRFLSESQLEKLLQTYEGVWNPEIDTLIVISVEKPQPKAVELSLNMDPGFLQLFWLTELVTDRTQHVLMPEHVVLSPGETKELALKYELNKLELIYKDDPGARWYGVRPGQVAMIKRPSPHTGESIVYRLCVRKPFPR